MTFIEQQVVERLHPRAVRYFSSIGSTNDEALAWMAAGAPTGAVVITDEQVKGKGRLGRVWHTPAGSALIVSVILRPQVKALSQITMMGALAIYDVVKLLGCDDVGIKWPNDVQLCGRKVSGVLPEAVWEDGLLSGVVLGMGINVSIDFQNTELAQKAISIEPVLGKSVDRLDLLSSLLRQVDYWADRLGSLELFETWKNRLVTLGRDVQVQTAERIVSGFAEMVDQDGALWVRQADGHVERVIAGDIALG